MLTAPYVWGLSCFIHSANISAPWDAHLRLGSSLQCSSAPFALGLQCEHWRIWTLGEQQAVCSRGNRSKQCILLTISDVKKQMNGGRFHSFKWGLNSSTVIRRQHLCFHTNDFILSERVTFEWQRTQSHRHPSRRALPGLHNWWALKKLSVTVSWHRLSFLIYLSRGF